MAPSPSHTWHSFFPGSSVAKDVNQGAARDFGFEILRLLRPPRPQWQVRFKKSVNDGPAVSQKTI